MIEIRAWACGICGYVDDTFDRVVAADAIMSHAYACHGDVPVETVVELIPRTELDTMRTQLATAFANRLEAELAERDHPDDLAAAIHSAILDYSQTEGWPIVGDDIFAAEYIAAHVELTPKRDAAERGYVYLVDLLSYDNRGGGAAPFATLEAAQAYLNHVKEWVHETYPDGEETWTEPARGMSDQWEIQKVKVRT